MPRPGPCEIPCSPGGGCDPARFCAIVDNLRDVVFQTDARGRWTFLNRAWEDITGFPVAESLGVEFLEFVHPEGRDRSRELFRHLIAREADYCRHETRYVTRDGGFRWIDVHARLMLNETDEIIGTSGTLSDVTDRRSDQDALLEARQRLEFVLASNPGAIFAAACDTNHTTFMSGSVRDITGYEPARFTEDTDFWLEITHPADLASARAAIAELQAAGRTTFRSRIRHANGTYRWVRCDARVVRDASGEPLEVFGCLGDETEACETEEALVRHAAILEAVSFAAERFLDAPSWEHEIGLVLERLGRAAQAQRVYVFQSSSGNTGRVLLEPRHEWRGGSGAPVPAFGCPAVENTRWLDSLREGQPVQGVLDYPHSGARSLVLVPIFAGRQWWGVIGMEGCSADRKWPAAEVGSLQAAAGILGAAINREHTEAALRYDEALLRTMAGASPLGLYVVDQRTDRILYANDRFFEIWGIDGLREPFRRGVLTNKEVVASWLAQVADPAPFAASSEPLQDQHNRSVVEDATKLRDGRTVGRFSSPIRGVSDQYFGRLYMFGDITKGRRAEEELLRANAGMESRVRERTAELEALNRSLRIEIAERQRAEAALAQREQRFRALIENTLDVIVVVDEHTVIRYTSPSITTVLGYEPEELTGRPGIELVDPADAAGIMAKFTQLLLVPGSHQQFSARLRRKDGSWRLVEAVGCNQIGNAGVDGVVITFRDITERRRLEDQFRQAQKMEAIGRLAGGVAHDFNNLLTVIRGYSEVIAKRLDSGNPAHRNVGQIKRAADRAAGLVQQLLTFSRKQVVEPRTLEINAAVADLDKMLNRLIGEDIELAIAPSPEPLYVRVDPTQFAQVVINLSVNARDAMPDGGSLRVEVKRVRLAGEPACRGCKHIGTDYAMLSVSDTGIGIGDEVRSHIFEPFFTTKEVGKGTGLGLAMVYGAVRQAGGNVCVESVRGNGTTFRICLPLSDGPAAPAPVDRSTRSRCSGSETVLLVEDEELVRVMIRESLREAGYSVLEARQGEQALQLAAEHDGPIHILLTDVVMPRMSGPELAGRLTAVRPEARVLYISGYPRKELSPDRGFLRKPFTPDELITEVRAVLDRVSSEPQPEGAVK